MAFKHLKVFLSILLMTSLVHPLNCESICLDVNPQNASNCDFPVTPLTHDEVFLVKNVFLMNFCGGGDYLTYRNMIVLNGKGVNLIDQTFMYGHSCSKLFDSISGFLYWSPSKIMEKYLSESGVFYKNFIIKRQLDNAGLKGSNKTKRIIEKDTESILLKYIDKNENGNVLIMRKPTSYAIVDVTVQDERKSRQEIVDLGTFSFFNPTGDSQEISVHVNLTDNLIIKLDDYYLYQGCDIQFEENDKIWKGNARDYNEHFLQRTHLGKLTVNSPLPPRTSATGRIFATLTLTRTPFVANMRIIGENSTKNSPKEISGELLKYENLQLRVENLKLSTTENTIIFASYIACLVGLISTLIIGCAIFLICLVAQMKGKQCVCAELDLKPLDASLTKKTVFVAEKCVKVGRVFAQLGRICGNICNCIYKEVV